MVSGGCRGRRRGSEQVRAGGESGLKKGREKRALDKEAWALAAGRISESCNALRAKDPDIQGLTAVTPVTLGQRVPVPKTRLRAVSLFVALQLLRAVCLLPPFIYCG